MSEFPLQNLFSRWDTISLELLKLYAEVLILRNKLDPSTLYIHKLCLVKASEGLEHETVIVTIKYMGSKSQWKLAFDRSQSSSLHDGNTSDTSLFEYPPGPHGDMMQVANNSLQSLKVTGHSAKDSCKGTSRVMLSKFWGSKSISGLLTNHVSHSHCSLLLLSVSCSTMSSIYI